METITFSQVGSLSLQFDLYKPSTLPPSSSKVPAVIFFHGGGMVAGCRQTLDFQHWLKDVSLSNSIPFLSADHRLIHPSTGADIIADVRALFTFLASPAFTNTTGITLDTARLAVVGESGGGYPALAAGIYVEPKPRVVFMQYPMGGELLSDHWVAEKGDGPAPWRGAESATREQLKELFEGEAAREPVAWDPIVIPVFNKKESDGNEAAASKPTRRREMLPLFWHEGILLDHILGRPGISAELRKVPFEERMGRIPEELRPLLLQGLLGKGFPPTVFLHGTKDLLVEIEESTRPCEKLREAGVKVEMLKVEGAGHALLDPGNMPNLIAGAREAQEKAWKFVIGELLG